MIMPIVGATSLPAQAPAASMSGGTCVAVRGFTGYPAKRGV
jgi:hypothetical protein